MERKNKIIKSQNLAETQKKFIYGVITLIVFTLKIVFIFVDHGLFQLYQLKREKNPIQQHISELRKEREVLISEKKRLESDLIYIEKLAREKYRMAKPGERVYKVISK